MNRNTILNVATAVVAAGALFLTFFSQHPNGLFSRLRNVDRMGFWLPNWRFFAPTPAQTDYHIIHRILTADGKESEWVETHQIAPRRVIHLLWFPDRRTDKGIFDAIADITTQIPDGEKAILGSPAYRLLSAYVLRRILETSPANLLGYQFMIVTSTGYDETTSPQEVLTSPYIPAS